MQVEIDSVVREVDAAYTVPQAIAEFSPYGEDALICKLNGEIIRSIDESGAVALHEGDKLEMYPLVIGG